MRLRELAWPDIPTLVRLDQALFGADAWAAPTWWAELAERPRRAYVVATEEGRDATVVGYGGIDQGGEVADIMTVGVAPGHQGRGTGEQLVRQLMAGARAGGARHLMLEVRADNEPARRLYHRLGFETLQVRRRYYQPGDVDALVMRAHLSADDGVRQPARRAPERQGAATEDVEGEPS